METSIDGQEPEVATSSTRRANWSYLLLGLVLVALVGGAFWLKTRPASVQQAAAPTSQEALMKAGMEALSANNPKAAAAQFRKILALNPTHYGATYQLAAALDRAGDPAEARGYWEKMLPMAVAVKDAPTLQTVRARLERPLSPEELQGTLMRIGIDAMYARKDPAAAAVEFRKLLALNPTHYGATYQLATALDRAGKRAEARPVWEKMLTLAESVRDQQTADTVRKRLAQHP